MQDVVDFKECHPREHWLAALAWQLMDDGGDARARSRLTGLRHFADLRCRTHVRSVRPQVRLLTHLTSSEANWRNLSTAVIQLLDMGRSSLTERDWHYILSRLTGHLTAPFLTRIPPFCTARFQLAPNTASAAQLAQPEVKNEPQSDEAAAAADMPVLEAASGEPLQRGTVAGGVCDRSSLSAAAAPSIPVQSAAMAPSMQQLQPGFIKPRSFRAPVGTSGSRVFAPPPSELGPAGFPSSGAGVPVLGSGFLLDPYGSASLAQLSPGAGRLAAGVSGPPPSALVSSLPSAQLGSGSFTPFAAGSVSRSSSFFGPVATSLPFPAVPEQERAMK
jgi:hypothetical protein